MKIYIKNMVCDRCILVLSNIFQELKIPVRSIRLGEIELDHTAINDELLSRIKEKIEPIGFAIVQDKKSQIVEKIKTTIIELMASDNSFQSTNLSTSLSKRLPYEFDYMSKLFSQTEGISLEQYFIHQKIEKAKELIEYDELNFTQISDNLGYSSLAHFSNQFKKLAGVSPSEYKRNKLINYRVPLDKV